MADLTEIQASQSVKIIGSDLSGGESNPVGSTITGALKVALLDETGNNFTDSNPVPVGQTTHDNLNLNANLQVGDSDVTTTNRVPTTDVLNLAIVTSEKISTTSASIARVGASNLIGRKAIEIFNTSTIAIYVGSPTVAISGANRGRPIPPNGFFALDLAQNIDLYIISASNATYVVTEVG